MASTYSTSLRLQLIGTGDQAGTWGTTTNSNLGTLLEQSITGVQSISIAALTTYSLSALNGISDQSRNAVLVFTGALSATCAITAPAVNKLYLIYNNTSGGYSITISQGSGTAVTIPNGATVLVYCDATNFYQGSLPTGNTTGTGSYVLATSPTLAGTPLSTTASAGTNTTQIATTAFVQTALGSLVAVLTGSILMWPTSSAPSGYLLCNGSAVSRTTYAALYALIGSTYGSGDGSTTFNIPNFVNSMPIGVGSTAALAGTGGSKDAIVVSHTHTATSTVTDPGHYHVYNEGYATVGHSGGGTAVFHSSTPSNTTTVTTGVTVATTNTATGVSGTNANLPPYLGINFIIKT